MKVLKPLVMTFGLLFSFAFAQLSVGIETVQSANDFATTQAKLEAAIEASPLNLMTTVDHTANAESAGLSLRPTMLYIFGNPAVGTHLMDAAPSAAIDLPQKMVVWQDSSGTVFVSYNNPYYLKARHNIDGQAERFKMINMALSNLAGAATSP